MYRFVTSVPRKTALTHSLFLLIVTLSFFWPLSNAVADSVENPVLLTIHGKIDGTETSPIQFDLDALTSMESTTFTTDTPWTDGPTQYTGVRISTLLASIGATSNQFEAIAANDYKFKLTDIDFDKYPILIAYQKNGEFLGVRKLGPLMIVFPFDDFPELLTELNRAASVWQLIEINIL